MPIRNMGSATMRFKEGIICSGSTNETALNVYGSNSGGYVAIIDNDENSSGHVLKLLTDGNGSGTRVLEMEDGDGDTIFRARADGRFGFGPDGVSSMGAGTFVVGIDNSSHTSDIAISQRLQHLGDSNTYLDFPAADTFNLVAGGNSFLKYDNSGNILINNANANVDTKIMADDGNVVLHVDAGTNRVGIGTTTPISDLDVSGSIAISKAIATPAQPAVDQGYLYTKSDGKLYWRSNLLSETELTATGDDGGGGEGGGGGGGAVVYGSITLQKNNTRTVAFDRATSLGGTAYSNPKGWLFAPFNGSVSKIMVMLKHSSVSTSTHGTITVKIFKNSNAFGSAAFSEDKVGDNFSQVNAANPPVSRGTYSPSSGNTFNEGDLLQFTVARDNNGSAGSADGIVTIVLEES